MLRESSIEKACVTFAKLVGIRSIKLSIQSNVGHPDRVFLLKGGSPLFVEFKSPGGKVSKKQQEIIDYLMEIGYKVSICDSIEGFKEILKDSLR